MFNLFCKKTKMVSPLSGEAVAIEETPDPVFKDKILGDGISIRPTSGKVVAPLDGEISQVAHTNHAVFMVSDDGLEMIIHLGIDTVKMNGEGFDIRVKAGDKVKAGDLLGFMDIGKVKAAGYDPISPVVVTNFSELKEFVTIKGTVIAGKSEIIEYKK